MNTQQIVDTLDAEIRRLEQARQLIMGSASAAASNGSSGSNGHGRVIARRPLAKKSAAAASARVVGGKVKRHLSADARARIVAAQRKRWARVKREKKAAQVAAD